MLGVQLLVIYAWGMSKCTSFGYWGKLKGEYLQSLSLSTETFRKAKKRTTIAETLSCVESTDAGEPDDEGNLLLFLKVVFSTRISKWIVVSTILVLIYRQNQPAHLGALGGLPVVRRRASFCQPHVSFRH